MDVASGLTIRMRALMILGSVEVIMFDPSIQINVPSPNEGESDVRLMKQFVSYLVAFQSHRW
jgi:hypothetical protein